MFLRGFADHWWRTSCFIIDRAYSRLTGEAYYQRYCIAKLATVKHCNHYL